MEAAYARSYSPFLDVLARHPAIRIGLHVSGCLFDWLREHRPEYVDRVADLVSRGQIELLTGGYYEPILTGLPEEDLRGQVEKQTRQVEAWGGRSPGGLWLAERVWEPGLASRLARAGVRYTFVDETHFLQAGLSPRELDRVYITEDEGLPLRVFPISKRLRYLIPFRPPEETLSHLRELARERDGRLLLFGDDGEKFGLWPLTYEAVYGEGWLERLFTLLEENQDWIRLLLPAQAAGSHAAGRIYLPSASYEEMSEWVLPPAAQAHLRATRERLREGGEGDGTPCLPGGLWRNFFVRYPESNHLNKRVIDAGRRLSRAGLEPERAARVRDLLWSATCNCAYWHGVFGGLYLPHLRDALYRRLLEAEHLLETSAPRRRWTDVRVLDLDEDGREEIVLANPRLTLVLEPERGGALRELSGKDPMAALGNGLTRRREAYHDLLPAAVFRGNLDGDGPRSIHDRVVAKEEGLAERFHVDAYRRASLLDHFLRSDTDPDRFHAGTYGEQGDFLEGEYTKAVSRGGSGVRVQLRRSGYVWSEGHLRPVTLEKTLALPPGRASFRVEYAIGNPGSVAVPLWFGVEWCLSMLSPDSPSGGYRIPGVSRAESRFGSRGETEDVNGVELQDDLRGIGIRMRFSEPALLWRMPVETINLSEDGFERVYQMSCLLPSWRMRLEAGDRRQLSVEFELRARGPRERTS